ncbi:MAG: glycosyltransferase [Cocleimonas sp.]
MKKTNILFLTTSFVIGGAEKVILDLMLNLDKQQFDVSIIALAKNTDMLDQYINSGIKTKKLDMGKNIGDVIAAFKSLSRYISKNKIDILHAHLVHTLPFQALLKLRHPKLKIVYTSHNVDVGGKHRDLMTWLIKPFRNADIVFSKDMINKLYKKNTAVIINGVDIEKFSQKSKKNTPFTFLSVGSIRDQKNQIFLVECAQQLKAQGYKFVIDIIGGGEENRVLIDKITQEITDKDVGDCVRMLGSRNDIPDLLKTAHCMVLPSHYEGLPIVLLEAGAANLPIISTPVGAIPTLVNESNGYLVALDSFCDVMSHVYNNYKEAEEKAQQLAHKINQQYSIKSMAKAHGELYLSLLK